MTTTTVNGAAGVAADAEQARLLRQQLEELTAKANKGGLKALRKLRRFLDEHCEIERAVGDLAKRAESAWIGLVAGRDKLQVETVQRQVAGLKQELLGPQPTALEALLVDNIAANFLAERSAQADAADAGRPSLELATFRLRQSESAQRRLLGAVRMLATVRALLPQGLAPAVAVPLARRNRKSA